MSLPWLVVIITIIPTKDWEEDEQEHPSGLFLVEDRSETNYSAAAVLLITAADLDMHIEHSDDQDKAVSDLVEVDQSILIHKTCFR